MKFSPVLQEMMRNIRVTVECRIEESFVRRHDHDQREWHDGEDQHGANEPHRRGAPKNHALMPAIVAAKARMICITAARR